MKIIIILLLLTFCLAAQWGGNTSPRWGGNSAPAWGGNPADDAPACEWIVTTTNPVGDGSLDSAITHASAGDTICFDESLAGETITLTSQLLINKSLNIFGFGDNQVIISGDSLNRVMLIDGSAAVTVKLLGLRITKGSVDTGVGARVGGGIFINETGSIITIDSCIVDSCYVVGGGVDTRGGGIYSGGAQKITITNSIVADNTVQFTAGVVANSGNGGGINIFSADTFIVQNSAIIRNRCLSSGTTTTRGGGMDLAATYNFIINTTVSGNSNYRNGPGGIDFGNNTRMYFSTVASNTSGTGGCGGIVASTTDSIFNSIIADNDGGSREDWQGTFDYLIETCVEIAGDATYTDGGGNLVGTDPGLGALEFNSGTWVHPIDSGDPVYNTGDCSIGTGGDVDQRGVARPQSTECDMGAYEVE